VTNTRVANAMIQRWTFSPGIHEINVYADEVAAVMAEVEPEPALIVEAKRQLKLRVAEELLSKLDNFRGGAHELVKVIDLDEPAKGQFDIEVRSILATTPHSVQAEFRKLTGRDMLPLDAAAVVDTGIPEPQRIALQAEQDKLVAALKAALGGSGSPAAADMEALKKALLAEMSPAIEQLVEARATARVEALLGGEKKADEKPAATTPGQGPTKK